MTRCLSLLFAALVVPCLAQELGDKYYSAVRDNDLPALRALAKSSGANTHDKRGNTPLMYAAQIGSADAFRLLLEAGAEINAKNSFDVTPLMLAASDPAKIRLLLAKGAEVNAQSKMGRSALVMAASQDGNVESVSLLLEKGADLKTADQSKTNALLAATAVDCADCARLLIAKGADVNWKDTFGNTALMNASSFGNVEIMKLLIAKGADVNAVGSKEIGPPVKNGPIDLGYFTPLLLAVPYAEYDAVKLLVDNGAKVNVQDIRGMTPLMLAVALDRPDPRIVKLLLAKGADPKVKSRNGETALDWARKFNRKEILDPLGVERSGAPLIKASANQPLSARDAAAKSMALLQRSSESFFKEGGCVSCHSQNLTNMAVVVARGKRIHVDEESAAGQLKATRMQWAGFEPLLAQAIDPPGGANMLEYSILPLAWEKAPPDRTTDVMLHRLAHEQNADGRWRQAGIARPPAEDSDFTNTALAIRCFQLYGFAGRKVEFDERIARAVRWLESATPHTSEDRNMRLLGLSWAGADRARVAQMQREILSHQREDGGWAPIAELASDAYATGQTLYALHETGASASDVAYQRGVAYLTSTQLADGSWHVVSRAPKLQPYFQSGFPYDHDQWISSFGTAWATMALAYASAAQ